MVSTRNQATSAPDAAPLVSIPTVYRPSTPGGRPIVEAVPGTRAQLSNGSQLRLTRSGIYHAPIPVGNGRPSSSMRKAPKAATLFTEDRPIEDTRSQQSSLPQLPEAASEKIGQMSTEGTGHEDMPARFVNVEPGNISKESNVDQMSPEATQQTNMPADSDEMEQGNIAEQHNAERVSTEAPSQGSKPTSPADVGPGYIPQQLKAVEMSTEPSEQETMSTSPAEMGPGDIAEQVNAAAMKALKRAVGEDFEMAEIAKRIRLDESTAVHVSRTLDGPPDGDATTQEAASAEHSQQDATSPLGAEPNELLDDNATGDNAADYADMFDNLSDIVDLNAPCASPSYSPILKPKTIKEFNEARLKQQYEEAELLLNNTDICHNEPGFKIRDRTFHQDPKLPSNLRYERGDPRQQQWHRDLCLEPFMDPFTGDLERKHEWLVKVETVNREEEHKQKLMSLFAADED